MLSSATPSVETCRLAQEKKVGFHRLSGRFGQAVLPQVELVDMNQDAPPGETSFGATLSQALRENFQGGPAVDSAAEPPGLSHLCLLQNLPPGGQLSSLQHFLDLSQRQRSADVPLLRLFHPVFPALPLPAAAMRWLFTAQEPKRRRGTASRAASRGTGAAD